MSKYNGLYRNKRVFEKYCWNNNCYTYAINQPINPYTNKPYENYAHCQPGNLGGKGSEYGNLRCSVESINFAKLDLKELGYDIIESSLEEYVDDTNCWKVAFCYSNNDYHWYRQNIDGTWSHKWGTEEVKYRDEDGNIIRNPEKCNRGRYKNFVGFYLIKKVA